MHVMYRVNHAENVLHILVVAPQEYVNIYSTPRSQTAQTVTEHGPYPPVLIVVVSPCRCEPLRAGCCGGEGVLGVS